MSSDVPAATLEDLLAHAGWARRLARRLTADDAAAEDLLQETWRVAWARPPRGNLPLRPWLAVVLRNLFLKHRQSEARRAAREASALLDSEPAPSAERIAERVEAQRCLAELVGALEEPLRGTVVLHYFEELSSAEIARRLAVPAGTVRWRLKTALAELRAALDARDERGGHAPGAWRALLLPLLPPAPWQPAPPRPPIKLVSKVVAGAGAAAVAVGTAAWLAIVLARAPHPEPPLGEAPSLARAGSGGPRSPAAFATFGPIDAADLAACQGEVATLRQTHAELARARREQLHGEELYALGAANPDAQARLGPIVERTLRSRPARPPAHSFDCRTWACRLLLVENDQEAGAIADAWPQVVMNDLHRHVKGFIMFARTPTRDPISGEGLLEAKGIYELRNRFADPEDAPARDQPSEPLPGGGPACFAERERLRAEIASTRAGVEANARVGSQFTGPGNPALAAEVKAKLHEIYAGLRVADLEVSCRARICRVAWPGGPVSWSNELFDSLWLRRRVTRTDHAEFRVVYLELGARPRSDGMTHIEGLLAGLARSGAEAACLARLPRTPSAHGRDDSLEVRFDVPDTKEGHPPEPPPAITARYGGTLADTPIGKCLAAAIDAQVLAPPLPTPIVGATLFSRFTFTPTKKGAGPQGPAPREAQPAD